MSLIKSYMTMLITTFKAKAYSLIVIEKDHQIIIQSHNKEIKAPHKLLIQLKENIQLLQKEFNNFKK